MNKTSTAPSAPKEIVIEGAREHNLKNLTLRLPKKSLVVFTGPSGSGKSSLAFDTIYAEGRRRYVESLSTYARQFLGQIEKPDFDQIQGLSPTISIEQKTSGNNPRSTVGTITEIYDHMRVLWAKLGEQHCHQCGSPVTSLKAERIAERLLDLPERSKLMLLSPQVRNRKGEFKDLFEALRKQGFARVRIDNEFKELEGVEKLKKSYKHDIDVVVDRLLIKPDIKARLEESVRLALAHGKGSLIAVTFEGKTPLEHLYSTQRTCVGCNIAFPELTHQSFSFNSPLGLCTTCRGLGVQKQISPELLVLDDSLSVLDGAVTALGVEPEREEAKKFAHKSAVKPIWKALRAMAKKEQIDLSEPWSAWGASERNMVLYGSKRGRRKQARGYKGIVIYLEDLLTTARKAATREFFKEFVSLTTCESCQGARLRPESRAVSFKGMTITDVSMTSIDRARAWCESFELKGDEALIATELVKEIHDRLVFLENVGLQYLSLNRSATTLSGGESQRIRLASQLGSELSGILYVLDEPSIGLHQRDNLKLLGTLRDLRDRGNSVIVVEHDRDTMEIADFIVDFGPGAGKFGGDIVAQGTFEQVCASPGSVTGDYLAHRKVIAVPAERRPHGGEALIIKGARANNLKGIEVRIPKGCFVCVTGVSGAGKSTLVHDILYPAVARNVFFKHRSTGDHDGIEHLDLFDKVIEIDQRPIGRTPRSNPSTYTKLFDHIRDLFSNLPEANIYGFNKGRFSFNVAGGRCEECLGAGLKKIEMNFLADVYVPCDVCLGKRFNAPTLRVTYRGRTIADVLDLSVGEAAELFKAHPKISRILQTLLDVGLDYVKLGQSSTTLSGGEAQRIKLSRELAKIATGDTLYILDEPSTGLHFDDIAKLLKVVDRLVDAGNTVVMIEHNLELIKYADYLLDIGPEGGEEGGHLIASGTPEEVAQIEASYTGRYLREVLP